jgi:enoyl-CoA hydratase/carnithine racemase
VAGAPWLTERETRGVERKVTTYDVKSRVALITLNRPDRLNAWTTRMEVEYRVALGEADADPDVRVVVVTGAGRGFSAGADTDALGGLADTGKYGAGTSADRDPLPLRGAGVRPDFDHGFSYPLGMKKPLIAAINGPAAGVGFVLACFADLRFAAAGAKLTTSFGRLGLPAEHGVSWILPRIIGAGRAADLLFSSRVVLAEEAERMGLVNAVLPQDELLPYTLDYARKMASDISPWSLRMLKQQLYADLLGSLDAAAVEAEVRMHEAFTRPDFKEGVAALTERRAPQFEELS